MAKRKPNAAFMKPVTPDGHLSAVVGSSPLPRTELTKKAIERAGTVLGHAVDPAETLVVGDTPLDVAAAHGAGARAVGVATGHYSEDELRAGGADYVLATLEEELPRG